MAGFLSNIFGSSSKNEEQNEVEYYKKNPNPEHLTDEQLFGISLGLIIGELNGFYADSLDSGKNDQSQINFIKNSWGIENHNDAIYFMEARLGDNGHRHMFNALLQIEIEQDCVDADDIDLEGTPFEECQEEAMVLFENLDEIYEEDEYWFEEPEEDFAIGADAWDFGRVVFIARATYSLGYISDKEAWHYIGEALRLARQKFNNWEDYARSYMLGRGIWGGAGDGDWMNISNFASDALENEQSPWIRLAW
ncbi:DUF1266 domain-containing protein [Dysgonomonas sp. 25]|uniref:DUF1266 domain-containing protein n=1 Tax=Dysgonomonas sp. 25 TaxID=2302933 RepID=UPI0013D6C572|nr:DUF1266 domain-containing protein [Dysgonomonas sp. 25]NDV67600.1 DUF1266 domain-containing protein [Dysgonomonas sp. 25]